ncbi:epididymal protein 13 [Molossus molossus]|uniref:epididymal protein 13 n=1 Tax=Molossus molossus TaxID=27622 RepID=UPI0017476932|nr:epididymal protein 13 [Molossus molossus]
MHRPEVFLKMPLLILLFLGLAEGCIPRTGLLSLQVLNEETSDCKEEVKHPPTTIPTTRPFRKRSKWNILRCAYMMVTFLFVTYNKGDWCYCHYCYTELDIRNDPCCSF